MPGISGFETAKAIRGQDRSRHTPIIFLTASDIDRSQMEEGYALGAVDFLVKPLLPVVLQAKVRGFVELFQDKQRARREAEQLRLLSTGPTTTPSSCSTRRATSSPGTPGPSASRGTRPTRSSASTSPASTRQEAIDRGWPAHELKVARAEGRFEDEGWRVRKDGSRFWANVVITALRDEPGILRGFSKITRDMTERKRAEENARRLVEEAAARRVAEENARLIQEQRERLHVTLASIGDAVISTDAEGRVEFLNPVAEELVGWKTEEAAGRILAEVFHIVNEETRQPVENPALRALRDGGIVGLANHTVLISRDGTERPIDDSAAPIRDAEGKVIGSVLVFRDISERKRPKRRSERARRSCGCLADTIPQLAWMARPDGHIFWYNRRWYEYTGTTPEQVEGWGWQSVHDPDRLSNVLERWKTSIATGKPFDMVFPLKGANGQFRPFLTRINPLRDPSGAVLYWFGTNTDIGERKRWRTPCGRASSDSASLPTPCRRSSGPHDRTATSTT